MQVRYLETQYDLTQERTSTSGQILVARHDRSKQKAKAMTDTMAAECLTVSGERVVRLINHMGLIRGEICAGINRDGQSIWSPRFWYPNGHLTPTRPTPFDLNLATAIDDVAEVADRRSGPAQFGRSVDDFLSGDDLPF